MDRFGKLFHVLSIATLASGTAWAQANPAPPSPPTAPNPGSAASSPADPVVASAPPKEAVPPAPLPAPTSAPNVLMAQQAVPSPSDPQLDKFHEIYQNATKIFGDEHTVLSPSFSFATDIKGRLSATDKHEASLSAVLMVPLFGVGGGHGADWWPVIVSGDETNVYQTFLNRLGQYQLLQNNFAAIPDDVKTIANTKWNVRTLKVAKQIFCQEQVDPELPQNAKDAIGKLCSGTLPTAIIPASQQTTPDQLAVAADQKAIINTVMTTVHTNTLVPTRHNLLVGPSLGIPLTKNPTDTFQYGGAVEIGGKAFRFMATGGLVGRYQGATYKDIFAAGWFVGLALSGEMGDELFHYFNGGSNLMTQLAGALGPQSAASTD